MTARKPQSDHDFEANWIDLNTSLIEAETRLQHRRRAMITLAGFAGAAILAMLLLGLIFWTAVSRAAEAATLAPIIMRF